MAKKVKNEKTKKKSKLKTFMIIFVILLILAGVGFGIYKSFGKEDKSKKAVVVKVLDSLDEYGYSLSDRDTKFYKSEFEKVKKILNESKVNEKEYATQLARLFAIDLYTLSSKVNKYDVGGSEFFYKDKVDMFSLKVMDTLYSTLADDTYGDRKQELPEVKSIDTVSVEETKYDVGEIKKDGYLVKVKWDYVKDLGYDSEASIVVCPEDGVRWSVVDFQPTLSPEYDTKEK